MRRVIKVILLCMLKGFSEDDTLEGNRLFEHQTARPLLTEPVFTFLYSQHFNAILKQYVTMCQLCHNGPMMSPASHLF